MKLKLGLAYVLFVLFYLLFFDLSKSPYIILFLAIGTLSTIQKARDLKRAGLLLIVLCLFMAPALGITPIYANVNNQPTHDRETGATLSADGDQSSDSITSFSETLTDDILFYPDAFNPGTTFASAGDAGPSEFQDYTHTYANDADLHIGWRSSSGESWVQHNVSRPSGASAANIELVTITVDGQADNSTDGLDWYIWLWNYTAEDWEQVESGFYSEIVIFGTVDTDFFSSSPLMLRYNTTGSANPQIRMLLDMLKVEWEYLPLKDSDHYGESFADVSDWSGSALDGGDSYSTDNDIVTIIAVADTANDYDGILTNGPSISGGVAEIRIWMNDTTGVDALYCWLYTSDGGSGDSEYLVLDYSPSLTGETYKIPITISGVESVVFSVRHDSGAREVYADYLFVGPADEIGWQHDGSTTASLTDDDGAAWDCDKSSDGDILTLNATRLGAGASWGDFFIHYDTTTTAIDLETTYYQFFEVRWRMTAFDADFVYIALQVDGKKNSPLNGYRSATFAWTTERINILAEETVGTSAYVDFVVYADAVDEYATIEVDYVKLYSIANWTVAQSGVGTDDYLYVDSNILYSAGSFSYFELADDWNPNINTATYNIWNVTQSSTAAVNVSWYVGGWSSWSDDSRGSFTSGTLTHQLIRIYGAGSLSAIAFIEDSGDPDILEKWVVPPDPDDSESITFTAVTSDTVDVYKVTLNAIVYPAGFSDVDYEMTEEQNDILWYYTFATMTAGYYLFAITASDGANTHIDWIPLTVRVSEIIINPISFFGVGEDFTQMHVSFEINKDCSFSIYEASAQEAEALTHTGSVTKGWDNVAWTKLSTTATQVNFSIKFVSGALSTWVNGSYVVAQVTFKVEWAQQTETWEYVTVTGEISKTATYQIYDDAGVLRSSGTISNTDFKLSFEMWSKRSLQEIDYGIKFTNGSSTCWYNNTFYAGSPDEYKGGGVDTGPPAWWQDPMSWVIIGGGIALLYIFGSATGKGDVPNVPKGAK